MRRSDWKNKPETFGWMAVPYGLDLVGMRNTHRSWYSILTIRLLGTSLRVKIARFVEQSQWRVQEWDAYQKVTRFSKK